MRRLDRRHRDEQSRGDEENAGHFASGDGAAEKEKIAAAHDKLKKLPSYNTKKQAKTPIPLAPEGAAGGGAKEQWSRILPHGGSQFEAIENFQYSQVHLQIHSVKVSKLETLQKFVSRSGVAGFIDNPHAAEKDNHFPVAVKLHDGRLVLADGNHRVAAAILRGDKDIRVRLAKAEDLPRHKDLRRRRKHLDEQSRGDAENAGHFGPGGPGHQDHPGHAWTGGVKSAVDRHTTSHILDASKDVSAHAFLEKHPLGATEVTGDAHGGGGYRMATPERHLPGNPAKTIKDRGKTIKIKAREPRTIPAEKSRIIISSHRPPETLGLKFEPGKSATVSGSAINQADAARRTMAHELVHHIHETLGKSFDSEVRAAASACKSPITVYAGTDHHEYLAETYAAYVYHNKELAAHDPHGHDFVKSVIDRIK